MTARITVPAWGRLEGLSRQGAHQAIKRCGIPVVDGTVDPVEASRLRAERTVPRVRTSPTPAERLPAPKAPLAQSAVASVPRKTTESGRQPAPLRNAASKQSREAPPAPQQRLFDTGYQEARAKRERAEAERAEIEVAKMAGRLVDRTRVEAAVFEAFRGLRDRVMNVPRRCAAMVTGMTDAREVELAIADELRVALGGEEADGQADLKTRVLR